METDLLKWNIKELSKAMKITENDVKKYFTDGRKVSFILERRLAYEIFHGILAPNEGYGYDFMDEKGKKWEVRSITKDGVYFCPSSMIGTRRKFEEKGFLEKLKEIEGYVLADVLSFPDVPFWIIKKTTVKQWWKKGKLGKSSKISHKNALKLISSLM